MMKFPNMLIMGPKEHKMMSLLLLALVDMISLQELRGNRLASARIVSGMSFICCAPACISLWRSPCMMIKTSKASSSRSREINHQGDSGMNGTIVAANRLGTNRSSEGKRHAHVVLMFWLP